MTTTIVKAKMTQIKWLLVGAACCLAGAILATPTPPSRSQSVAFVGPVAYFPQKTASTNNWQRESSVDGSLEQNKHKPNQFADDRIIKFEDDSADPQALVDVGQLKRALRSLGLRKIRHQPASFINEVRSDEITPSDGSILERAVSRILQQQIQDHIDYQDRPFEVIGTQFDKRSSPAGDREAISSKQTSGDSDSDVQASKHEFIYVITPISEQVLPFQSEKFAQGYKNFVSLAGPNYKIGLRKLLTPLDVVMEASGNKNHQQTGKIDKQMLLSALGLEQPTESEGEIKGTSMDLSDLKLNSFGQLLKNASSQSAFTLRQSSETSLLGCRPVRAKVQISRDDFDMQTGQLVRQCTGMARLNSCEGHCVSSVQPTLKSPSGFAKHCTCCNEGSFKRVQVRLNDCFLPPDVKLNDNHQLESIDMSSNGVMSAARKLEGYLDVIVNEPYDCKCRQCDSLI